jgi:hypothetical protein
MRSCLLVTVVIAGISLCAMAQDDAKEVRAKPGHSGAEMLLKTTPAPEAKASSSMNTSKELTSVERQTARANASQQHTPKKQALALKPEKEDRNPAINIAGSGSRKTAATGGQSANPYRGRLKQKSNGSR